MTPDVINRLAYFLSRCELKGAEVPAFNECMQALQAELARVSPNAAPPDTPT
jgi:hypothetical protein